VLFATPAPAQQADGGVQIRVDSPKTGSLIRGRTDVAAFRGIASAGTRPTRFEVMLVIDVSGSTKYPSGIDVDGDGELGESQRSLIPGVPDTVNTDPDDSVLAAEIHAAKALLGGLDPARVQVGVISFSGEIDPATMRRRSPNQADARVEWPLTSDFARVEQALDAVLLRGPSGGTNMEAAVKLAVREVNGSSGTQSKPYPGSKRVVLFLTDGYPSLPFGLGNQQDPEDTEAVIDAANLAKVAKTMVNVYGLGPTAIDYPVAAEQTAAITGGLYTPVRRPGDIVVALTGVSFANIDDVVAVNTTLGEMSGPRDIELNPDGSFKGFVPVAPGMNRIRVSALASDGSRGSTEFDITFKYQEMTDAELESELERVRKRNREIQLIMEQKRQDAFRKLERERMVEIEVEDEDEKQDPDE
jgi:hypothetical protein